MEPLVAVYDASVLHSNFLRDFLVRLAVFGRQTGWLRAKWTGRIHREWIRSVRRRRPEVPLEALLRTRRLMDQHVRGCRVRNYQRWERKLTLPDPDDRHVLAAALACVADAIVTFNVKDFPAESLRPFGVEAVHPDVFVKELELTGIVERTALDHWRSLKRPPLTGDQYLAALANNQLPLLAARLRAEQGVAFGLGDPGTTPTRGEQ